MEFKNLFADLSDYVHNEDKTNEVLKLLVRRDSIEGVKIQRAAETPLKEVCIYTKNRQNPIIFKTDIEDRKIEKLIQDISGKGKEIGFSPQ